jgi:nitrogenase molybdenum-cofactor synthesis protein NifE
MTEVLEARKQQVLEKGKDEYILECGKASTAGSVSQRACVFCGSRVVLYPIADALHLVHGPIGCAVYTWDIRGSLSSGPELHRLSFSTDLREREVIYGGEKKLYASLSELILFYQPKAAFVYSTCIIGLIGDDVDAVCARVGKERGIPVISVHSEGFKGTKKDGYKAACEAVYSLIGKDNQTPVSPFSINILGEFNLAGETWIIKDYYRRMGIEVTACLTGDGRVEELGRAHRAKLNVVQCSGSMTYLAKMMRETYGIPFIRVSYFGIEDMTRALYEVSEFFNDREIQQRTEELVKTEVSALLPKLAEYRKDLEGKKAAVYVGGSFKAFSMVKALRHIGMETVVVGSQTGTSEDYEYLKEITSPGTIICDDTNPLELSGFILEKGADILIGGVKERPIAYKMGIGFCDHNHERKEALAGYTGMINFAREIHSSVSSPVWKYAPARRAAAGVLKSGSAGEGTGENRGGAKDETGVPGMTPIQKIPAEQRAYTATGNACKLCSPLGACISFRGIEGCIPLIHGSQGCSTYIRRYGISHFREPIDIASSNFTEAAAIFGGRENLFTALDNLSRSYRPAAIGIASSCLSETIGEDVAMYLRQYEEERRQNKRNNGDCSPVLFYASTASYRGTHMDGFHEALWAVISAQAGAPAGRSLAGVVPAGGAPADRSPAGGAPRARAGGGRVNLISGFVSTEDIRELHSILASYGNPYTLIPDYSESLDGPSWETYQKLPEGGTKLAHIRAMGEALGTLYLGYPPGKNAGLWLEENHRVPLTHLELPIGIENSDRFFQALAELTGRETPDPWTKQRGRLIDAYIDGHKYCGGKRAIIYGEEDLVIALASFLDEIGVIPVIAASGAAATGSVATGSAVGGTDSTAVTGAGTEAPGKSLKAPGFRPRLQKALRNTGEKIAIMDDADFISILDRAKDLEADFIMGHSKGLYLARNLGIPLVRCGFPIHDRIGGQRILHLGYRGTLNLFDLLCNALMQAKQDRVSEGYTYI